jgi:drug/metabolite transporter (DMT)-like permease
MTFLNPSASARVQTVGYTGFALIAFAANSVLCRLAFGKSLIDAASFSTVRLLSGALVLLLLTGAYRRKNAAVRTGNWISAVMLFVYATAFSFAYISLSAGTGALILFAAVQATMIIFAMFKGGLFFARPGCKSPGCSYRE